MRIAAVIQARMASTRLPGKALAMVGRIPLVLWTVQALEAVSGLHRIVVATTSEPSDDPLAELLRGRVDVHRGPVRDVLSRVWEAVAPDAPDFVVRETADNPFVDPGVVARQIACCGEGRYDYVGTNGWPIGVGAEVASATALATAYREATDAAEREHVMPFLYARPERFRIGACPPTEAMPPGRFTVDTPEDLAFARAVADRLGPVPYATLEDLRRIIDGTPELLAINAGVRQKPWQEAEAG